MKHIIPPLILLLLCAIVTERSLKKIALEKEALDQSLTALLAEKERALETQKELQLTINSQSDPAWIELVLFRELGLIPEGDTKILFKTTP